MAEYYCELFKINNKIGVGIWISSYKDWGERENGKV